MRILFVYDSLSPYAGGSQLSVLTWLRNLKKTGYTVKLMTDQHIKSAWGMIHPDDVIVNKSFGLGKKLAGFSFSPFLFSQTKDQIRKFNPDIIHVHEQLFVSLAVLKFAKKASYPTLTSFHGDPYKFKVRTWPFSLFIKEGAFINRLIRKFQFSVLDQSDYLTTPTDYYQKLIKNHIGKSAFSIPYPVDAMFFSPKKEKPGKIDRLIVVSRLAGEKNIDVLIDMMVYLKDRFKLTIAGNGIDSEYFKTKVKKLDLGACITFYGWMERKKIVKLIKDHHIFLSASNFETFGITYIEALACGIPCGVDRKSVV